MTMVVWYQYYQLDTVKETFGPTIKFIRHIIKNQKKKKKKWNKNYIRFH